jgi:hypothetical protein
MSDIDSGAFFAQTLEKIGYGDAAAQASELLADLVKAVGEHDRQGTLTLTITVKPRGKDSGQVEVTANTTVKRPVREIAPSMFFVTEDGGLARDNPRQKKFPFADAPVRVEVTKASNQ